MYPRPRVDISVNFCGRRFENPFILAAAPPSDDLDMVRDAFKAGFAGAVLKTTSVEGVRVDLAYPMMSSLDSGNERLVGMGNIDLISEHHVDVVEKRIVALKGEFPAKRVIASVSGSSKETWQEVVRRVKAAGADLIECSFSCPQGSLGERPGAMLAQDAAASKTVAGWIKEAASSVPVIIKLTPQVSDIAEIAAAVKDGGADAVCVGNTVPALMGIDVDSFVPAPNVDGFSTYSGLSGTAVKPISLRCIAQVKKQTGMAIAGSGGAITWSDALEFMLAGAGVVEFCTAVMHYGVGIIEDLIEGLSYHLERRGIQRVEEVIGASLKFIVSHDELPRLRLRPSIDKEACVRCDGCLTACRDGGHRAIAVDAERLPIVDDEKCVGCGLCYSMCPVRCIEMRKKEKGELP
jgi:dihydropyrimidine dehydrogenase (NAD+) subunit PreA